MLSVGDCLVLFAACGGMKLDIVMSRSSAASALLFTELRFETLLLNMPRLMDVSFALAVRLFYHPVPTPRQKYSCTTSSGRAFYTRARISLSSKLKA